MSSERLISVDDDNKKNSNFYNSINNNDGDASSNSVNGEDNHTIYVNDDKAVTTMCSSIPRSLKLTFRYSKLNYLLVFLPLGFLAKFLNLSDSYIFIFN